MRSESREELYAQLGHLIDGLWFIETEKRLGFEKAYEIDEAVWVRYAEKEARWILRHLNIETPQLKDVLKILELSLFNTTLTYEVKILPKVQKKDPSIIEFWVKECKTYTGMTRAKRTEKQIYRICEGIGIAFFENMLKAVDPEAKIDCLFCPYKQETKVIPSEDHICAWKFVLPNILE